MAGLVQGGMQRCVPADIQAVADQACLAVTPEAARDGAGVLHPAQVQAVAGEQLGQGRGERIAA